MKIRLPTQRKIEELVAFLPQLHAEGFTPIKQWGGGTQEQDGVFTMPWPEYEELVETFFRVASSECWCDHDYLPEKTAHMLNNTDFIKTATLSQIKTMLTYCSRGECFCDGHWAAMIEGGHVRRLLERLAVLVSMGAP